MQNIDTEVRNVKYIHTLECSTSSKLCDPIEEQRANPFVVGELVEVPPICGK